MFGRVAWSSTLLLLSTLSPEPAHCINENDTTDQDSDLEEVSDSVDYMVVIEHGDGWRCSGSLVSLRVVLTSARCGRPRGADLWALAGAGAGAGGARRVARAALAGAAGAAGPAPGLAALELEQPFGERAAARPILMATAGRAGAAGAAGAAVAAGAACHAARLLPSAGRPRLRVVRLTRARGAACARLPYWPAARDDLVCLEGAVLCERDQGVGVVCQGMLYGVLSATVPAEARADEGCGEAHAAHVLSRWRRFLHCAHTSGHCGRGECTSQCTEYDLLLLPSPPSSESPTISTPPRALNSMSTADLQVDVARSGPRDASSESGSRALPSRTTAPHDHWRSRSALQTNLTRTAAATTAATATTAAHTYVLRHFEPYRADFKAGEYGDNAAEYAAEEAPAGSPAAPPSPRAALTPPGPAIVARRAPPPDSPKPALDKNSAMSSKSTIQFITIAARMIFYAHCHVE
ncbi:uncharacterized protein LOC126973980 [Leptidea sinapis]|uniref:uncharacterized protein LOC126973980 n=1 Tax=Leptidea sinapis TaxID=189913 RepID=UPI0021C2EA3B|nr:uncharacterized protein LOC126973980 [Leptidea sinapis]